MAGGTGSDGNMRFLKGSLIYAVVVMLFIPAGIALYMDQGSSISDLTDQLTNGYIDVTGQQPSGEEIWGLTGIYTPYGQDADGNASDDWGRTLDGWIYGQRINNYTPSQFDASNPATINRGAEGYSVYYDSEDGLYRYASVGADLQDSIRFLETDAEGTVTYKGDIYSSVAMSMDKKSNIFFTAANRVDRENGTFYYTFGGTDGGAFRYTFQPLQDYLAVGTTGSSMNVDHTQTSLSLIWYQYNSDEGISGQLVLSGSDRGVAYITSDQIIDSYNTSSYTSKFVLAFNGIDMNVYIQLNPWAITHGYTPAECYNAGLWSILITSPSTSPDVGLGTLSAMNLDNVFETIKDLLTFDMDEYKLSPAVGVLASLMFSIPFYLILVAIAMEYRIVWIFAGITAAIQALNIF